MIVFEPMDIPDVLLLQSERFVDARGYFCETFLQDACEEAGLPVFVQDNESLSTQAWTLRGLHFQLFPFAQAKLVRCVRGALFDVAVDLRSRSPTFGRHVSAILSAQNGRQAFVPEGFAHGFLSLEPDTVALYKVSVRYAPGHDRGLAFDDPDLGIAWPLDGRAPILSDRDRSHPRLAQLGDVFPELG